MSIVPSHAPQIDWSKLEQRLQLFTEWKGSALHSLKAGDLTEPAAMRRWLETYASVIGAEETQVAATYFSSFLRTVALSFQYAMSLWNAGLALTLDRLTVHLVEHGGRKHLIMEVADKLYEPAPLQPSEREQWRQLRLDALYRQTLRPLVEAMSQAGGISAGQLWSQLVVAGHYYLLDALEAAEDNTVRERVQSDYRFLTRELPPETFGRKTNPFNIKLRFVEDIKNPEEQIPLKAACCLYYKTAGGTYCYTCPKLSADARSRRLAELRAHSH